MPASALYGTREGVSRSPRGRRHACGLQAPTLRWDSVGAPRKRPLSRRGGAAPPPPPGAGEGADERRAVTVFTWVASAAPPHINGWRHAAQVQSAAQPWAGRTAAGGRRPSPARAHSIAVVRAPAGPSPGAGPIVATGPGGLVRRAGQRAGTPGLRCSDGAGAMGSAGADGRGGPGRRGRCQPEHCLAAPEQSLAGFKNQLRVFNCFPCVRIFSWSGGPGRCRSESVRPSEQ